MPLDNNLAAREYTGFELYLEGIKIPTFNNVTIRENEGGFPQASISFPATSGILRTLPGTVVQVFGPDPRDEKKILLFEGEIVSEGFNKSPNSKTISFECRSFLNQWQTATATPKDSLMTPQWRKAKGEDREEYINLTQGKKPAQETNKTFGLVEDALRNKLGTEIFGNLKDKVEELDFTQAGEFSDELVEMLNTKEVTAGDVHFLILFFLKKFEISDVYYGMVANSINLANSVSSWPNANGKIGVFKLKAVLEEFFKFTNSLGGFNQGSLNLFKGLRNILSTIHYTIVAPSNFTSSHQFWDPRPTEGNEEKPVRAYFMPNIDESPPAKFNTIFPHQLYNISYNRNMMSEPTRTIGVTKTSFPAQGALQGLSGITPFVTEPLLNITQDSAKNNTVGLTPEETYKGITLNRASFDYYFTTVAEDLKEQSDEDATFTKENYRNQIQEPLNQMAIDSHYKKKLSSRSVNASVEWSPYRMAGIPGSIIQNDDLPSITGVISSISTNISGNGRVQSTLTFRNVRLIHKNKDLEDSNFENMVNDLTLDPFINSNPTLFDPNVYDFEEMGKELYSFIGSGTLHKESSLIEYSQKSKEKGVFVESSDTIDNIEKIGNGFSILDIIKDSDGNLPQIGSDKSENNKKLIDSLNGEIESLNNKISLLKGFMNESDSSQEFRGIQLTVKDVEKEIEEKESKKEELEKKSEEEGEEKPEFERSAQLTSEVFKAISTITEIYDNIDSGDLIETWTNRFTYRNIISKGDYFSSIGINPTKIIERGENYKDGMELFSGTQKVKVLKDKISSVEVSTEDVNDFLEKLNDDIEEIRKKLEEGGGASFRVKDLEDKKDIKKLIEDLNKEIEELKEKVGKLKAGKNVQESNSFAVIRSSDQQKERIKELEKQIKEKEQQKIDIVQKIKEDLAEEGPDEFEFKASKSLEDDLFKVYNLTRRDHIKVGFSKHIKNHSVQDNRKSVIKENLTITE